MKRPIYRIVVTDIGHFWAPVGDACATREDAEKFIADRGGKEL